MVSKVMPNVLAELGSVCKLLEGRKRCGSDVRSVSIQTENLRFHAQLFLKSFALPYTQFWTLQTRLSIMPTLLRTSHCFREIVRAQISTISLLRERLNPTGYCFKFLW